MLTLEEYRSLEAGDIVQMGTLFRRLSDEPIDWVVLDTDRDKDEIVFETRYFGVRLGAWRCRAEEDQLKWEEMT